VRFGRTDPGECPVCGAAHCACGPSGPITVVQLPARDHASARTSSDRLLGTEAAPALEAGAIDSAPSSFTTATYRGRQKAKR